MSYAPEKYFLKSCGEEKKKEKRKEKRKNCRNNIRFRGKATALISNRVTTVSFPRRQGNNSRRYNGISRTTKNRGTFSAIKETFINNVY